MHVLVISGSSAFATIVETGGYEVTEARLGDAHAWREPSEVPAADVVLIDIADFDLASGVTAVLGGLPSPPAIVLIEPTNSPAWDEHDLDADVCLQPPLGRDTVLAAISVAVSRRHPEDPVAEAPSEPVAVSEPNEPDPQVPAAPVEPPSGALRARTAGLGEQMEVVARAAEELPTVADVATTIAATAAETLEAPAAALLCPNEESWSVVGGFGTRSLELRVSLPPEHWLIENLLSQRRGAIIDRSDIVRSELANAPLASRDHLVIACDHASGTILIVGRDGDPFAQDDLRQAHTLLREASPYLVDALALHSLALSLDRFRELR